MIANTIHQSSRYFTKTVPLVTKREKEVLQLIALGLSTQEIAKHLYVSDETIKSHRKNLLRKMNACNGASLIRAAYEAGLLLLNFTRSRSY